MSRSRRDKRGRDRGCGWHCIICHPLWRDASEKALTVEADLDAIDHLPWFMARDIDAWAGYESRCDACGADDTFEPCGCVGVSVRTEPLKTPLFRSAAW